MATQGTNGLAVATVAAGALLAWSGIRGTRVTVALKELLSGQQPAGHLDYAIGTPTGGGPVGVGSPPGSATGQAIAQDALRYVGHAYLFGGAPGTSGQQPWDCSSFVNWVLGHDEGLAIPGFKTYDGSTHGPNTLLYLAWPGATTVGHDGNQAQPGDLCVWQTHMGIAIGNGQMVSARSANSNPPTGIDTINGDIPGEVLFVRRLKAVMGGQPTLGDVRARVRGGRVMATQGVNGIAVAATGVGVLFAWSGIKGAKVTGGLRSLLAGQQPKTGNAAPIGAPGGAGTPAAGVGSASAGAVLGGQYSNSQLQSLWIMAGGSPSKAAVAACIADHESSGNPNATSGNPDGGENVGLWQLDTKGKGAGYTVAQLQNALTNARVAVAGSGNGTDWSAWSTAASCGV